MRIIYALAATAAALAAPAAGAPAAKDSSEPKYCFQYETATGSRIQDTECLTKAEWARRGVDVDALVGK